MSNRYGRSAGTTITSSYSYGVCVCCRQAICCRAGVEPPLQAYDVAPAGVAVTLMEVVKQFKTVLPVLFVIAATGGVVF